MKDKDKLSMWIKTVVSFDNHKELKKLAVDKNISLAELLREALKPLLKESKNDHQ